MQPQNYQNNQEQQPETECSSNFSQLMTFTEQQQPNQDQVPQYYNESQQNQIKQVNQMNFQDFQIQQRPKFMYKYYYNRYTNQFKWNLNYMYPVYYQYFKDLQKILMQLAQTINKKWTEEQRVAYITFLTDVNNYIRDYIWKRCIVDFNVFKLAMKTYSYITNPLGAELYDSQLEYLHKKSIGYDFFQDKRKKREERKGQNKKQQNVKTQLYILKEKKQQEIIRTPDVPINLGELLAKKWPEDKYINLEIFKKENANLVFIGHVDSGKSTLTGNILKELNQVDEQEWLRNKQQAKQNHMEAWQLAGIADVDPTQRIKGITIEYAKLIFSYGERRFTLFDAPGHKNYVPNMIMGACQADIAVLIVSAKSGEFQAGFVREGQTREHALLAKSLGVTSLVIAVTKMSTVDWAQERFNQIKDKVQPFLKDVCGFSEFRFIPIDSISNINIHQQVQSSWYKGQFLLKALEKIRLPERNIKGPLRLPVIDKFKDVGNLYLYGKLESGILTENQVLTILPQRKQLTVKQILNAKDQKLPYAIAGENVKLRIKGLEQDEIKRGNIICNNMNYCLESQQFKATITVIELPQQKKLLSNGYEGIIHIHAVSESIQITKVQSKINKQGKTVAASYLLPGETGNVIIKVENPICLQKFQFMPNLGRFTLRDQGKTIGYGEVMKIKPARTLMKEQKEQLQAKKQQEVQAN